MSQKYESKRKKRRKQNKTWIPLLLGLGGLALLVAAFLALKGGSSGAKAAIEVKGAPAIKVDQEQIDLGNVKLGKTVEATFKITNVGDQTLEFEQKPYIEVVEGCWPPDTTIGSMVLKPGESTQLSMQFLMHGDMGGMHNFRVHLPSNDPTKTDYSVTVLSNWVQ